MRPHRRQPTRLPHPWDSPGKNTGVGCHFLLQCMTVKSESEVAQSYPTLCDPMDCSPPGSSVHGIFQTRVLEWSAIALLHGCPSDPHPRDSPGKNTGAGCHFLLQCMKVKSESEVAQSCPTLSDPMDCSLPGSSVHGIFHPHLQQRTGRAGGEGKLAKPTQETGCFVPVPHLAFL